MVIGLLTFIRGQSLLLGIAEPKDTEMLKRKTIFRLSSEATIYLLSVVGIAIIWQMLQWHAAVGLLLNGLATIVLLGLGWFIFFKCEPIERSRMIVLITLTLSTVVFWALFEQSAASMTLFADRVMDHSIFGLNLTTSQFGSLNPLFIFLFAPLFAWLWTFLGRYNMEPNTPVKFSLGLAQAGLGFGALVQGPTLCGGCWR